MSIGSNLNALRALRRLDEAGSALERTFERLASGSRINRASDDAAGLAVASSLNLDARIKSQAIRNVSDAMSYLNIADGATGELKSILIRLRELSTQASNGTLSNTQRRSLEKEAQALQSEYNRVADTAKFNGVSVFDGKGLSVQVGFGTEGVLKVGPSVAVASVGDGTFQARQTFAAGAGTESAIAADVNGDGKLDIVTANYTSNNVSVMLANGDGTFQAQRSFAVGNNLRSVQAGDLNGDGVLDLVTGAPQAVGGTRRLLGNGDGTFRAPQLFSSGNNPHSFVLVDVNSDGALDVVSANASADSVSVHLGYGDGTFQAQKTYAVGPLGAVRTGDFNGDGVPDLVTVSGVGTTISVLLGIGDGSFQAPQSFTSGQDPRSVVVADVNNDSLADVVTADFSGNTASVLLSNGDGTFQARVSFSVGTNPRAITAADFNGDGVMDLVTTDNGSNTTSVLLGNGDGTFRNRMTLATGTQPYGVVAADMNGDGVQDLLITNFSDNTVSLMLGNGNPRAASALTPLYAVHVSTRAAALNAQGLIDNYLNELNSVSGAIGVGLSRLSVAAANLQTGLEATKAAASRITDADIAEESARLVSTSILQQAAAAVLAQAKREPEIALTLLRG